jgi:hypothetical protein
VPTWFSVLESQPTKHIGMLAKHIASKNFARIAFPQMWVIKKLDRSVHAVATIRCGDTKRYYNSSTG